MFVTGLTDEIAARLANSHIIRRIDRAPTPLPSSLAFKDELERLIANWDWRSRSTPWLWMRADTNFAA